MLAFVAQFKNSEWVTLIHGKTRGKAKYNFMRWNPDVWIDNSMWNEIRLRRLPGLDDKPITFENAKAAGFEYSYDDFDFESNLFINDCRCEICKNNEK